MQGAGYMSTMQADLDKIEKLRLRLYTVAEGRSFTDLEVLSVSKMLDSVLNEYQRSKNRKTKTTQNLF